jgi:hypothetical protein
MKDPQSTRLNKEQLLALRGLRLPGVVLKLLDAAGIYCEPAVSIRHQATTGRYMLRGTESGGAVAELGAYCGFVDVDGGPLPWLQRVDGLAPNQNHAVVVLPQFVRVQMFRNGETYELLITEHRLENVETGKRPRLANSILFHGLHGALAVQLWGQDRHLSGRVFPVFYTRSGEPSLIPEKFHMAVRRATAGSCCIGCSKHCHLLQPELSRNFLRRLLTMPRPTDKSQTQGGQGGDSRLPSIEEVLSDFSASFWLKNALRAALTRDPVDAAHDSEVLAWLLEQRCRSILDEG